MSKAKNDTNHLDIADGNVKWKQVWQFPQNKKINTPLSYNPATELLNIYPRK